MIMVVKVAVGSIPTIHRILTGASVHGVVKEQ